MSGYQVPYDYPSQASNNPEIPHSYMGDSLRHFPGARSSLHYIPTSSGSNITQSSSALFMVPQSSHGYVRPGSMYIKGTCVVSGEISMTADATASFAWTFAGQNTTAANIPTVVVAGNGSANSLFNRWTCTMGGLTMSYSNTNQFSSCVLPHLLNKDYCESDDRQSGLRGWSKVCNGANLAAVNIDSNKTATFCVPVPLPCFNSETAFPLLLLNGGVQIEVQTETLFAAIHARAATNVTGFSLSGLTLCYELTNVTDDYKRALIAAKRDSGYLVHINDVMSIGPQAVAAGASTRLSLGVALSSLKGGVFSMMPVTCTNNVTSAKFWTTNSLQTYDISVNGQIVTLSNINDDTTMYQELQRSLARLTDTSVTSALIPILNTNGTNLRNNYTTSQFCAGFSTNVCDGWELTSTGVPIDNLAMNLTFVGTANANLFQSAIVGVDASLYLWLFYDSVLVIGADGMCTLRK